LTAQRPRQQRSLHCRNTTRYLERHSSTFKGTSLAANFVISKIARRGGRKLKSFF